ncbi:MAG: hypothetical protein NTW87_22435 [Planctomycetota bacterium]|nr:hypothetical protein [Planctomycetota bacterium]
MFIALTLFGFPVRLQGEGGPRAWLRLLRGHGAPPSEQPVLTIVFVKTLAGFSRAGYSRHSSRRFLGAGFAVDYEHRRLYYPIRVRRRPAGGGRRRARYPLPQTVAFALCLLAEARGGRTVANTASGNQAPLYLHASAVATPRGALVFCGRSTFGKSTISGRLLSAYERIADDCSMILVGPLDRRRQARPRIIVLGSRKRRGRRPSRRQWALPIAGVFWLKKSREFRLEPMSQAEAASLIVAPVVNWRQPAAIRNRLLMVRALLRAVPCRRLHFRKERRPLIALLRQHGYA